MSTESEIGKFLAGRSDLKRFSRRELLGVSREILIVGGLVGVGIVALETLPKQPRMTDEQKKAAWLLSQKGPDLLEGVVVSGEKARNGIIPAKIRNKPATESGIDVPDSKVGVIIKDLDPGTVIEKSIVVLGAYTNEVGKRVTDERWLAIQLDDGTVGFVHPRGLDVPLKFYQVIPVNLKEIALQTK